VRQRRANASAGRTGKVKLDGTSPEVASLYGAWYALGKNKTGMHGEKHLARPRICAVRHRPVARRSSRAPWRRALEHAGRALASAWLHPGPGSRRWSLPAAQTDLGGDQSRVHDPRGPRFQAPQLAAEDCMVTQARVGVRAHSLDASGLTRPSTYDRIGAAALRRLTAPTRRQMISLFERLIMLGLVRGRGNFS